MTKSFSRYYRHEECRLEDFIAMRDRGASFDGARLAERTEHAVPLYDAGTCRTLLADPHTRLELLSEWGRVLADGPGALGVLGAFDDPSVVDAATDAYLGIIEEERHRTAADHFATGGANARIWDSCGKLCLKHPELFARYFGNPLLAAVCEAWLGPGYQMTAQVNLVRPGGKAQECHRDYHLGFQTPERAAEYPSSVHRFSAELTLQGAIAHCDMPLESGPTKLLPFSQLYPPGYLATELPEFREYFEANKVQIPLSKGDMVFFSPALFHAAGANTSTDIQRMANLVQVSSAFGRPMESLDRRRMCRALYPAMLAMDGMSEDAISAAIDACADGYSFPTNLDLDPPVGGLAPETQAALFKRALASRISIEDFNAALDAQVARRMPE